MTRRRCDHDGERPPNSASPVKMKAVERLIRDKQALCRIDLDIARTQVTA